MVVIKILPISVGSINFSILAILFGLSFKECRAGNFIEFLYSKKMMQASVTNIMTAEVIRICSGLTPPYIIEVNNIETDKNAKEVKSAE